MERNGCMSLLQGYLENSPLIVLGSGASMPYELPSMGGLADETKKSILLSHVCPAALCFDGYLRKTDVCGFLREAGDGGYPPRTHHSLHPIGMPMGVSGLFTTRS